MDTVVCEYVAGPRYLITLDGWSNEDHISPERSSGASTKSGSFLAPVLRHQSWTRNIVIIPVNAFAKIEWSDGGSSMYNMVASDLLVDQIITTVTAYLHSGENTRHTGKPPVIKAKDNVSEGVWSMDGFTYVRGGL